MARTVEPRELAYFAPELDGTRSRLVWATATLVHAESYHSVGVKAICDLAEVRRGSFYHYFESKEALMLVTLEEVWTNFEQGLAPCRDTTLTPRERLEAAVGYLYEIHAHDKRVSGLVLGCPFGNLAAETTTLDEAIRLRLVRVFEDWALLLEAPIASAHAWGEIELCDSTHAAARRVLAGLQGLTLFAKVCNDPDVIATGGLALIDQLWGCEHDHVG
jgi:TetR/AcrR family transcriptional repressor of nem operon